MKRRNEEKDDSKVCLRLLMRNKREPLTWKTEDLIRKEIKHLRKGI